VKRPSSGWFVELERKQGMVVEYRWREQGRGASQVLGSVGDFPTEKSRWKEVFRLGLDEHNSEPRTIRELVDHWLEKECPETEVDPNERRAFSTRDNYRGYLRKWIVPKWGDYRLNEIKAPEVEEWLASLRYTPRMSQPRVLAGEKASPQRLAPGSRKKIRDTMHIIFEHARRWGWWPEDRINPISKVRQGGTRRGVPARLNVQQLAQLIYQVLRQRERVMVLLDFATGIRRGELAGARWEDCDFAQKVFFPRRSIVKQRVGKLKTEASTKCIPLDDDLIVELLAWRAQTPYNQPGDYIFASPRMLGKQPYWLSRIMQHHIKPAALAAGIPIKGWHTLRHSYTTLLRQNNNDPKVVQDLLRHASQRMTQDVYDTAVSAEKQEANSKVVRLVTRALVPARNGVVNGVAKIAGLVN
jgi:integrase